MNHGVVKEALQKGFEKMVNESTIPTTLHARILGTFTKRFLSLESHIRGLERGTQGERGASGSHGVDGRHGKDGKDGRHGRDGKDGLNGKDGRDGVDGTHSDPKAVIEELKKLQGNDRLHVRHIAGIEEIRGKNKKVNHGGGGGTILVTDLSSQCNGITRTFTVPNITTFGGPILLTGTQFPNIYRMTTDYTWSLTNKTITLDASLGAPATGQTLILVYQA